MLGGGAAKSATGGAWQPQSTQARNLTTHFAKLTEDGFSPCIDCFDLECTFFNISFIKLKAWAASKEILGGVEDGFQKVKLQKKQDLSIYLPQLNLAP